MTLLRQRLLILFALILGAGQIFAANGTRAQRAYNAALAAFQYDNYPRAEMEFAQFLKKNPDSTNAPSAVLLESQAAFNQRDFTNSIALLTNNLARAGALADQYVYWTAEAQFAGNDFMAAADTFGSLAQHFPDSSLRLRATVEQAASLAWANRWPEVISLLGQTNGVFQRAALLDPSNDLISRGRQLQAQGLFIEKDFTNASIVLNSINPKILTPDLYTGLQRLLYQLNLTTTNLPAAFMAATNLYQTAKITGNNDLLTESTVMRSYVLEEMGRIGDAIAAYSENLTNNAADDFQRQAVMKITALAIQQQQFSQVETNLQNFLARYTNSSAADVALLSLGELQLKDHLAQPGETNLLAAAHAGLDSFVSTFINSPLLGEAYLNRGWCFWLEGKFPQSLPDFQAASRLLPLSENLAIAKFKTGDAQFAHGDYPGALANYRAVVDDFTNFPAVQTLNERALYQILRTSLELSDFTDASNAWMQISKNYPLGELIPGSELLYGENLAESGHPTGARKLLQEFEQKFPGSPLRAQVEFAIARTYELEDDWTNTIGNYTIWLANFPTNSLRPKAMYALALAHSQAGNESNAFTLFTNFVAQFPANSLAPEAQWWIADHFFRLGGTNYADAEANYEYVYQNFPSNNLTYAAQFMAGRAAAARQDYSEAIGVFTPLETTLETALEADTNYSGTDATDLDLLRQALLANGKALMAMPSADTNNPLQNYQLATNVFNHLYLRSPTNEFGALAWCYMGDCDLQLTNYDAATNDYVQVLSTNFNAMISTRSMAQVGLGVVLEKKAALATGTNQAALLQSALNNYLDVYETAFGKNLREGETADPFWTNEAWLKALLLIETQGAGDPNKFIDQMEQVLPQLKDSLEKIRASLPPPKS